MLSEFCVWGGFHTICCCYFEKWFTWLISAYIACSMCVAVCLLFFFSVRLYTQSVLFPNGIQCTWSFYLSIELSVAFSFFISFFLSFGIHSLLLSLSLLQIIYALQKKIQRKLPFDHKIQCVCIARTKYSN